MCFHYFNGVYARIRLEKYHLIFAPLQMQFDSSKSLPTLHNFDKKVAEADAFLQLLINQVKVGVLSTSMDEGSLFTILVLMLVYCVIKKSIFLLWFSQSSRSLVTILFTSMGIICAITFFIPYLFCCYL